MTVSNILNEFSRRNIEIEVVGKKIRLHGSCKNDLDESLVESIRTHKAEIITFLSSKADTDLKGRPNWCAECQHGRYETEGTGSRVLWCDLAKQAVLDMQKCVLGYWAKNGRGFPVTLH